MAQASNLIVTRHIPYSLDHRGANNGRLTIPHNDIIDSSAEFSIAMWVKVFGAGHYNVGRFAFKWDDDGAKGRGYELKLSGTTGGKGDLYLHAGHSTSYMVAEKQALFNFSEHNWHLIVATCNEDGDKKGKLYLDRVLLALDTDTAGVGDYVPDPTRPLSIAGTNYGDYALDGKWTEPRIFNKALSAKEISDLYYNGIIPSNIAGEWLLSEGSDTSVADSSGNGNNGTLAGTYAWTGDTPHKQPMVAGDGFSPSCRFDGSSGKITVADNDDLKILDDVSMVCYIKPLLLSGTKNIISMMGGGGEDEASNFLYSLRTNGKKLTTTQEYGGGSNEIRTTTNDCLELNKWQEVVLVRRSVAKYFDFYVDDILIQSISYNHNATGGTSARLAIGGMHSLGSELFSGYSIRTLVYSRALTQKEITDLYYYNIIPSDPVLYLKGNEGGGDTIADHSGHGNHGTLSAGVEWDDDTPFPEREIVGGNLVKNGDFERATAEHERSTDGYIGGRPLGWNMSGSGSRSVEFALEDGKRVLKLSLTANGTSIRIRNNTDSDYGKDGFRIKPNTEYKIKFRMKLENITGDSDDGAKAIIYYSDQYGNSKSNSSLISSVKINQEWVEYEVTKTSPLGAVWANIQCRFYGNTGTGTLQGDAFFDNIEVKEV